MSDFAFKGRFDLKDKKTYILFAALMIGIAVFTVYIQNTMNKEVVLKGVVSTTTTQSETKATSKDKDKKEDKNTDDTKDKNKDESKDKNEEKDDPLTSPVTTVPAEGPEKITTTFQFPMDINYATYEALICVPNIGEKTAESILSFIREKGVISDMDMLLEINGIGEAKLNDLKRYFYVSDVFTVKTTTTTTTTASSTTSDTISKSTTAAKQTTPEQTAVSKTTTPKETKPPKTTTVTTTTPTPVRKKVNINTADADELMACLLIDRTQADEIVAMRGIIGGYTNIHEVLYCESISDSLYAEIDEYLEI